MPQLTTGLLTIGIPAYNGGSNLRDLLLSITSLGLDEHEYEILIVDNCSADDTDSIVELLKSEHPNLRYYKNKVNIGRIENWNRVIELSAGEYLIIMNVNDRFMEFDARTYINYLDEHPEIPMLLTDLKYVDHIYPAWIEAGLIDLEPYIRKTFLEVEYLEYHSLGVLHQHIFRKKVIVDHHIQFDPKIPRTTDRVFAGEVAKAGGGIFYYVNKPMVSWHLNKGRYHFNVHNNTDFNFDDLWVNEYKANLKVAALANISLKDILRSQLITASFKMHIKRLRLLKTRLLKFKQPNDGMEVPTAAVYYAYLKTMAELNNIQINYFEVKRIALNRVTRWYLRSLGVFKKNSRSLSGIINNVSLVTKGKNIVNEMLNSK